VNYVARIIGHKRARELWMLGRRYSAQQMLDWGLVNAVVPMADLDSEVNKWCDELLSVSPTCLKIYKASFVEEFQDLLGQADFLRRWLVPQEFWDTEQREGTTAFLEKRRADYSRFRVGKS
jgi:2-ketocyclohexanecarboxyl-CoA hydrolase